MKTELIKANGEVTEITPKNNKTFELEELQKYVGGYIEIVNTNDGRIMVIDEEGKLNNKDENSKATYLFENPFDIIVGDVVVCDSKLID